MLTAKYLQELKNCNICGTNDLSSFPIDNTLPIKKRFEKFLNYIENPYFFTCNNHKVKVVFFNDGFSLEQSLINVFKRMEIQD